MKNPKASLTAEFEDAYGSQSSAVTNESRPRSNAKKAKKKRSGDSFWTRMLIFVCGALVGLGVFAGVMYFTKGKDAEAKREKRRSSSSYRTSSSNRSSSGSRGDFYRPKDDEEEEDTSSGGRGRIIYSNEPSREGVKPCANYMYESLIGSVFHSIVCVVLTGMGHDGTEGIQNLARKKKLHIIAQDEKSCVVNGMPGSIVATGMVNEVVDLDNVAQSILANVGVR